jgi:hypothetical protein
MARPGQAYSPKDPGMVGEKDPSGQLKRMQCLGSAEGSCQQGEVRFGEFLSPPEQARGGAAVTHNAGTPPGTSSWRPLSQYGLAGALSTVAVAGRQVTAT